MTNHLLELAVYQVANGLRVCTIVCGLFKPRFILGRINNGPSDGAIVRRIPVYLTRRTLKSNNGCVATQYIL